MVVEFAQRGGRRTAGAGDLLPQHRRVLAGLAHHGGRAVRVWTTSSVAIVRGIPRTTPASIIASTT